MSIADLLQSLQTAVVPQALADAVAPLDAKIASWWGMVVSLTGEDDYFRLCCLPIILGAVLFWSINIPLLFFNFFPQYNPLERWKVQKGRYESSNRVFWMVLTCLFNQCLLGAISMSPPNYQNLKGQGQIGANDGVPGVISLAWQLPACAMLYDVLFFGAHCLMHTRFLYRNFHWVHHRSKISLGISAAYFHPVDYVISGLAVLVPPMLVSRHVMTYLLWLVLFQLETTNAHMGYNIPGFPDTRDHDFHHSHSYYSSKQYRFVNMGAFNLVMDKMFGTRQPCLDWWAKNPNGIVKGGKAPIEKLD